VLEKIARNISRYNMFPAGASVGVAVSGGADSVCLLHALFELAPRWNLRLKVIHVEHGIRGMASQADAGFVAQMATGLGLPFLCRAANVPAIDDNLEQAARRIRHNFYRELIDAGQIDRVATGHTRNDQAETVLYRILRGSGISGLSGIRATTSEGIVRPLLSIWRSEVEDWLRNRHTTWREDETNADPAYVRNRIRHQLLPFLREEYNPNIDETLARMATLAADDEAYWDALVPPRPFHMLKRTEISNVPPALARRIIRKTIENVKGDLRQIDFFHVEAVLELARSSEGSGRVQIPGVDILRSFDWIRFRPLSADPDPRPDISIPISPPCTVAWPPASTITFKIGPCDRLEAGLNWPEIEKLPGLELRTWKPGDSYQPAGRSGELKIKQLFQEARVPLWERRHWPVLVAGDKILWSRQFGPAAGFAVTEDIPRRLTICEENVPDP